RSGLGPARLLLADALPFHVRPDLLRHLRRADGLVTHDRLQRVAATLEVDRIAAERHLLLRHSVSSLRRLGCGGPARRLPIWPRVLCTHSEGGKREKYYPWGLPTRGKLPGGGMGLGGAWPPSPETSLRMPREPQDLSRPGPRRPR